MYGRSIPERTRIEALYYAMSCGKRFVILRKSTRNLCMIMWERCRSIAACRCNMFYSTVCWSGSSFSTHTQTRQYWPWLPHCCWWHTYSIKILRRVLCELINCWIMWLLEGQQRRSQLSCQALACKHFSIIMAINVATILIPVTDRVKLGFGHACTGMSGQLHRKWCTTKKWVVLHAVGSHVMHVKFHFPARLSSGDREQHLSPWSGTALHST